MVNKSKQDPDTEQFTEGFKTGLLVGIVVAVFTLSSLWLLFR